MNLIEIPANKNNYGEKRNIKSIKYIVIHYTANDGDTAKGNGNYFKNKLEDPSSAHYFVDDNCVVRSVPDNYIAYSVGGKKYSDCDETGGGSMYGIILNKNSISVELCDTVRNNKNDFTEQTIKNAVELVKYLMDKYNIDINHIYRHFDVNGKMCPLPMINNVSLWNDFLNKLGDDAMTTEEKQEFEELKSYVWSIHQLVNQIQIHLQNDEIKNAQEFEQLKSYVWSIHDFTNQIQANVERINKPIYNYIDSNMPSWSVGTIQKLVDKGILQGTGSGLNLNEDMLRMLVILDRQGVFG